MAIESSGQSSKCSKRYVALGAFNSTDVRPMELTSSSEFFLREAGALTKLANIRRNCIVKPVVRMRAGHRNSFFERYVYGDRLDVAEPGLL